MKQFVTRVVVVATVGVGSLMGMACRTQVAPTQSSENAASSQPMTKSDYEKSLNKKIQALTPVEEQAIMAATVGFLFTDFKKKLDSGEVAALGINVDKVKEAIKKDPQAFAALMSSKVTVGDMVKASKKKSLKDVKVLSPAFQSDLDAFPLEDMWPSTIKVDSKIVKTGVVETPNISTLTARSGGPLSLLVCGVSVATSVLSGVVLVGNEFEGKALLKQDLGRVVVGGVAYAMIKMIFSTTLPFSLLLSHYSCN